MKIEKITVYNHKRPFKFGFRSSHAFRINAESIILRLDFENEISGYGESIPRAYVTGESPLTVTQALISSSPILFCYEINTIADIEQLLNEVEAKLCEREWFPYNSALGALDLALLDALGKSQKLSLRTLLGPTVRDQICYSFSIPILSPQEIEELLLRFRGCKPHFVKVLLRGVESDDLERVRLARSLLGSHADIRVDANGNLTYQQAMSIVDKLKELNITAIEQPLPKDDIWGLQRLKKNNRIPVVVDESMCGLHDAKKLIENQACDILNIKISKCGGLLRSKQIADFAKSRNVLCQVGAHVGETEILDSAGMCFALTTEDLVYFEGRSFLLFNDLEEIEQLYSSTIGDDLNSNPGLGLSVKTEHNIAKHCLPIFELTKNSRSHWTSQSSTRDN